MSKQAVIEKVRTLLLAHTPFDSNLSKLVYGYAYPYDTVPDPLTNFPAFIVERRRTFPARSEIIGTGTWQEATPLRVDVVFKRYLLDDQDRPNIGVTDETAALRWESELHAFLALYHDLDEEVIEIGTVETQVGRRYWFTQELFGVAAFFTPVYEVSN